MNMQTQVSKKLSQVAKASGKQPSAPQPNQSGFTIVESLMAMVVASILLIALSPAIILSVATRIQARRVEIASVAARTYSDGVISGTITPPSITTTKIDAAVAPTATGTLTCPTTGNAYCTVPATNLYCVDGDGDRTCTIGSVSDMILQVSAYHQVSGATADSGYSLGVRVYRADSFKNTGTLKKLSDTGAKKTMTFTGGLGDLTSPLLEITTDVVTKNTQFKNFCDRISGSTC